MLDEENRKKLEALGNRHVMRKVHEAIGLCKPAKVMVVTDSDDEVARIRQLSMDMGEERPLAAKGHTVHYDGYFDQARDKANTRILIPAGKSISRYIKTADRKSGLKEVLGFLDGSMSGKEMYVRFFCLGPVNSRFSIPALQITDSLYVAHSEDILYRKGYEQFKRLNGSGSFFFFLHSAGKLENGVCAEIDKRRIYIDLETDSVYTVNNQYAGNSLGLKKLAMRLGIQKAAREGWMLEHMFIMAAHRPAGRKTYFTGAFPSACGKTSTAMIRGQTIVADDIAYLRPWSDGTLHAVNVEQGIFGIIENVNPHDDPVIHKALTTPRELILSNVLTVGGKAYWLGMGKPLPEHGINYSGEWHKGKRGPDGREIPPANKNARYTIRLQELDNVDDRAEDPSGVPIAGFIFGGRDSNTSVPVSQSLSWAHGVLLAASLESETTAATLGKVGELSHSPMANMDFLSIPLGMYIGNYLKIGKSVKKPPLIFSVNYFLKDEGGEFMNSKLDKKVWLLWMEGRAHGDFGAIETPVGYIPRLADLQGLFRQVFGRRYTRGEYERQFSIRLTRFAEKFARIEEIYAEEPGIPDEFRAELASQRERLQEARERFGKDEVSPSEFE
ncbi:MAG: phosphoenolpyruvate carboxykinase (GTP) [Candidatus Aenigmarchaeota archaeon]|nr:phosphoenolpyruvate carboxykinase (GTP) [Candidatus Aenigmarchaeota archaeon]